MIARQGDVLIMSIESIPENVTEIPRDNGQVVLAYGEVTGHSHAISGSGAALLSTPDTDDRFLRIMNNSGLILRHEEHDPILLPKGNYVVRIQREYTSANMAPVRVVD